MSIARLTLKNFRCFKSAVFNFSSPVTIIQGDNGSGKTTLLEALHYGCHLRSFRTHIPLELVADQGEYPGFNIQIATDQDEITIGVEGKKRSIKINGSAAADYHDLIARYKVVTFIEDDLNCIKGYPEARRALIDQALSVQDQVYYGLLRKARKIVDQRTKILQDIPFHEEQYRLWTQELLQVNRIILEHRHRYIKELNNQIAELTHLYGTQDFLRLEYRQKRTIETLQDRALLLHDELRVKRSLYGFHLDDIEFIVYDRNSRTFASRGQQKLALMFLKVAQARLLARSEQPDEKLVFLIDDFLTDFDMLRIQKLLSLIFELRVQLIITVPQRHDQLYSLCSERGNLNLITL
jgi:DNA replication and repair protein RecF